MKYYDCELAIPTSWRNCTIYCRYCLGVNCSTNYHFLVYEKGIPFLVLFLQPRVVKTTCKATSQIGPYNGFYFFIFRRSNLSFFTFDKVKRLLYLNINLSGFFKCFYTFYLFKDLCLSSNHKRSPSLLLPYPL